ncbi:MAG: HigA family addiction module antitoxin [Cyclobacteriaceae bacterium]
MNRIMEKLMNIHPGEILERDFLEPMGITAYRLSKSIGVQQTRISQIIKGKMSITADMATRLAKFFGTSAEVWMNLQSQYEIRETKQKNKDILDQISPLKLTA